VIGLAQKANFKQQRDKEKTAEGEPDGRKMRESKVVQDIREVARTCGGEVSNRRSEVICCRSTSVAKSER
jgi:hypothetical protein